MARESPAALEVDREDHDQPGQANEAGRFRLLGGKNEEEQ